VKKAGDRRRKRELKKSVKGNNTENAGKNKNMLDGQIRRRRKRNKKWANSKHR
jgi:hypothetical protein